MDEKLIEEVVGLQWSMQDYYQNRREVAIKMIALVRAHDGERVKELENELRLERDNLDLEEAQKANNAKPDPMPGIDPSEPSLYGEEI